MCFRTANMMLILSLGWVLGFPVASRALERVSYSHNTSTPGRYEKYEGTFSLDTEFDNPFDANVIAIDAIITTPDHNEVRVPAFITRHYQVTDSVPEQYVNPRHWIWKIRFAPSRIGTHQVKLRAVEQDTRVTDLGSVATFTCRAGSGKGMIRRDPHDVHCLQYDDGSPRINIGHNVCWTGDGLPGFQNYFAGMQGGGENWTRLWMTHFYNGTILEWRSNGSGYFEGLGRYSQQVAQRLDGIVEAAEHAGIAMQLVLQHHGQFSTTTNPNWDDNPYNVTRGGMLNAPEAFFTHPEARRLTRNKYRYIVARWGYSPAILAWELWNEVQFTDGWRKTPQAVIAWHQEMSDWLRRIDPHRHLITTSSETGDAFAAVWDHDSIDLVQHHQYGNPSIESYRDTLSRLNKKYPKPVILGEFGAGHNNPESHPESLPEPERSQILDGLVLHNGIWAAFFTRSSGHLWWWDTYIEPLDLYRVFMPLRIFTENESLAGMTVAPRVVSGAQSLVARPLIPDFWGISTQTEFWSDGSGFPGMDRLSATLHGSSKSDYRSDPVFHLTMPMAGQFIIAVDAVSGWGDNRFRVRIDGRVALSQSVVNDTAHVEYSVPLQAGEQTVQIENTGQDWLRVSHYEFRPGEIGIISSLGLMSDCSAYLWIYDVDSQYGRIHHGLIADETITVPGLIDGAYEVTVWGTREPGGLLQEDVVPSRDQVLLYTLPPFVGDIAVKIRPVTRK